MRHPIRLTEIAEILGVSKQRAHQIAEEPGFPILLPRTAAAEYGAGREVTAWAKRCRGQKSWR